MKIGINTNCFVNLSLDEVLKTLAELELECVEFCTGGNWNPSPHLKLDALLESQSARTEFLAKVKDYGLTISALNCSGNQLHPVTGKAHDEDLRKTFQLAKHFGLDRVVTMSGLPGGGPEDKHSNWVTTAWPPETTEILRYQWEDVAIPYWKDLSKYGANLGITKIAIENHGAQLVYNLDTLLRLREASGNNVGLNFDPSHIFWMGGDPLQMIEEASEVIFHVHAKDTRLESHKQAVNTLIETRDSAKARLRSWNYVTVGYGHGEEWWKNFMSQLRMVGYDDVLSIEHEDFLLDNLEAVKKATSVLKRSQLSAEIPQKDFS